MEITQAHEAVVGGLTVRRLLPHRLPGGRRRSVGAWVFADHFGPAEVAPDRPLAVGPHPHTGLATVTWLFEGEQRHRDSMGSDVTIRPGQLNLMHSGHGTAHAEESLDWSGPVHGVQLWVAQPEATRHGPAAFEHHADLPRVELGNATGTLLVGTLGGATSAARADTPLLAADLSVAGPATVRLDPAMEHGVLFLDGTFGYLEPGRSEVALGPGRVLLLGGEPLGFKPLMWWNFVARTGAELRDAYEDWTAGSPRFGEVDSALPRIDAPSPPDWSRLL